MTVPQPQSQLSSRIHDVVGVEMAFECFENAHLPLTQVRQHPGAEQLPDAVVMGR